MIMKKLLIFLLFTSFVCVADMPPVTVAIFDFTTPYKARLRNDIGVVGSLLTANLSSNPQFTIVDRSELGKVLKEQALGLSGVITPETAAKVGRLTGANILVTGQVLALDDDLQEYDPIQGKGAVLVVASVIGAETGRTYALQEQGSRANLVRMANDLSSKISETITNQYTNLVANANEPDRSQRLAQLINSLQGKPHPAVSIKIDEQFLNAKWPGTTVRTELGMLLKEAGFDVVDENSDKSPDVLITGDAVSSINGQDGGLFSAGATVDIKAQTRLTGKILAIDRQDANGVDDNRSSAARKALEDAADDLAERLIPVLTQ